MPRPIAAEPACARPMPSQRFHRDDETGRDRSRMRAWRRGTLAVAARGRRSSWPRPSAGGAAPGEPRHGIAMHGEPALPPGFEHVRYANPAAPKGGRLIQGVLGTFDSLNPFIVKGLAPTQIRGYVVESLLARGYDEPFTLYGLLARTVETDDERSYVTFTLDPAAKFSDGKPVTADDVIFSWQLLRDKGRPNFRTYYAKVAKAEALSERVVRFDLDRRQRSRTAADPRADAGAGQARDRSRHLRGDHASIRSSAAAPM